jgi:hypothetical protein
VVVNPEFLEETMLFWLQVSILALLSVMIFGSLFLSRPRAQHGGAGDGALNVWQLIDEIEAERRLEAMSTGRHHLRPHP